MMYISEMSLEMYQTYIFMIIAYRSFSHREYFLGSRCLLNSSSQRQELQENRPPWLQ